jgi:hypothetical protein
MISATPAIKSLQLPRTGNVDTVACTAQNAAHYESSQISSTRVPQAK